ncbi:diguanylate cyclase [Pseudoduganella sp. SL102]|uniref:GGDEF domain-containing response regulator n=1 Tax=Pseudoduganella sp. SL102 TaxID=2995154 RepID=UPI00248C3E65|nr:diguanylate cyclase [Pseudoduganella sp. SL102]WBS00105.1 diguanylate cyclase [Pseudoduganella sp. SL102]
MIDDDAWALEHLAKLLGDLAEVHTALGGIQGLAETARILPDLIVCDIDMPDIDGLLFCRHLQADVFTKNIPILCVSSSMDEGEELAALTAGAVDVIRKPMSPMLVRARVRIQIELCEKSEMLLDMTRRDPLTGIFNRRYFDNRMRDEWARHRRMQEPIAVAMVDVDHFKAFNDHYGHMRGDECLMEIADRLRHATRRPGELVARYGGEEFVMLLPGTSALAADAFGKWVCEDVRAMKYPHARGKNGLISVSVGLATAVPDESVMISELIRRADTALYAAKRDGRDCHAVFGAG